MAERLLLVRHGESEWNAEGRWQGWADPPLSEVGREQARHAARRLADQGFTAVVTSDLARARETAALMTVALHLDPPTLDVDLRERDVGEWTGYTRAEIEQRWPGMLELWRTGTLTAPPGGEEKAHFVDRVVGALERWATETSGELLVIGHGGCIRALDRHLGACEPMRPGNLAGRWLGWDGALSLSEPVDLTEPEESTASPTP